MDDAVLASLEHQNMVATMSLVAASFDGAVVREVDGVTLLSTALPVRLFNQVLISGREASDDALRNAVADIRTRTDQWLVNLRSGSDDRFLPLVEELGLVPVSPEPWMPGMGMWPLPAPDLVPVPAGHEIREVTDAAGLADHVRAGAEGFGMPVEWLEGLMGEDILAEPGVAVYVGYTDGEPVTTGLAARTGRTVGVYNIATVPTARQRGYGAAMTMRIVDDGARRGCDAAILQASDMGKPVYERLGFRTVVEYVGYVDPATIDEDRPPVRRRNR